MKYSNSKREINKLKANLNKKRKKDLRVADFCAIALYANQNRSLTTNQLLKKIRCLWWRTEGKTPQKTISTVLRYQNPGLFRDPRNAKFRLKASVYEKLDRDYIKLYFKFGKRLDQ